MENLYFYAFVLQYFFKNILLVLQSYLHKKAGTSKYITVCAKMVRLSMRIIHFRELET